jgi:hypothetical protein
MDGSRAEECRKGYLLKGSFEGSVQLPSLLLNTIFRPPKLLLLQSATGFSNGDLTFCHDLISRPVIEQRQG